MKSIQEIHNSNLYGVIIEAGCSATIASALMNEPGSSKTIYDARQPYSKDIQESLYGSFKRSVSKEWIKQVLEVEGKKAHSDNFFKKLGINFILAASWQLPSPDDATIYAHGWVGLFDMENNVKHYLHFSLNRNLFRGYRELTNTELKSGDGGAAFLDDDYSCHKYAYDLADRKTALQIIGQLATNVLHTGISGDIETLEMPSSDMAVLDMAYINDDINYHLLINTLEKVKGDYFLVFDNGEVTRIEDLLRKSDEFVIQKGSFNPLHQGHLLQMNGSVETFTKALPVFLISTFRYDKPHLNYDELKDRIEMFEKAGYPLIICKSVTFYETFSLLNKWSFHKNFYFCFGTDTLNRIYETDLAHVKENITPLKGSLYLTLTTYVNVKINQFKKNFKFLLFPRKDWSRMQETHLYDEMVQVMPYEDDGVTSTKIRNGLMENKVKL